MLHQTEFVSFGERTTLHDLVDRNIRVAGNDPFGFAGHFVFNNVRLMLHDFAARIDRGICHFNGEIERTLVIDANFGNDDGWEVRSDPTAGDFKFSHVSSPEYASSD